MDYDIMIDYSLVMRYKTWVRQTFYMHLIQRDVTIAISHSCSFFLRKRKLFLIKKLTCFFMFAIATLTHYRAIISSQLYLINTTISHSVTITHCL